MLQPGGAANVLDACASSHVHYVALPIFLGQPGAKRKRPPLTYIRSGSAGHHPHHQPRIQTVVIYSPDAGLLRLPLQGSILGWKGGG